MKPAFAFQWHIADEFDQRCIHCYIFAEGACVKTGRISWEQIQRVLIDAEDMC